MQNRSIIMNEIKINDISYIHDNKTGYISSRAVASGFSYNHKSLCEVLSKHFSGLKRQKVSDSWGRPVMEYLLTKRDIMILPAHLKPNEKTIKFQIAIVDGFLELEKKLSNQLSPQQQAIQLAKAVLESEAKNKQLEGQVQQLEPIKEAYDHVVDYDGYISMEQIANKFGIGRNILFRFLRDRKKLKSNNMPYQKLLDAGFFKVKQNSVKTENGNKIPIHTVYATAKGQKWINEGIVKYYNPWARINGQKEIQREI